MTGIVTRFAPSPTGLLHLGHAFSALKAWTLSRGHEGRFILRIEDIDTGRCRRDYNDAIYRDLGWLGLTWETPVRLQSEHLADYSAALERLKHRDLVYPCFCTRRDIAAAANAPHGPDGPIYPGTCRNLDEEKRQNLMRSGRYAWRLDVKKSCQTTGALEWSDAYAGRVTATPQQLGDVVIARKDLGTSYHLAVTVDDALQGITDIVRGKDLFDSTHIHRLLQALLGLPTPRYHHHALILDGAGEKLSKRNDAQTLESLREAGRSAAEIREMLGFA